MSELFVQSPIIAESGEETGRANWPIGIDASSLTSGTITSSTNCFARFRSI